MKKTFTKLGLTAFMLFIGVNSLFAVQEPVDPNTRTEWPSPYPIYEPIISENFQDWPNTRTYSASPLDCNFNNRETQFNWQDIRIHLPTSGETGTTVNFYLVSCEIQPFCDTQSATFYLNGDTAINANAGKFGLSNPGVTSGAIAIYDSSYLFPKYENGDTIRRGAFIVGQIPSIRMIQYTTSSFGPKRGFNLEYSLDRGKTWIMLRKEHGKSLDSTLTTSGYQLTHSTRGIVWEEKVSLENAMLRFSANRDQPQIVRIHDVRVFGDLPLFENMDDTEFETNSGIAWGDWMGLKNANAEPARIQMVNGVLRISGNPVWTKVVNLAGQCVRTYANDPMINLSDLKKGVYLIQSKDEIGLVSMGKVCL